jgi:hypothetical protein
MKYRVIAPHRPGPGEPLVAREGDGLRFERRATEWEGWLWCITGEGRSGWVPESWVEIAGETCLMRRDYDATELAVTAGDEVVGELTASGWIHVRHENGKAGWVPLRVLEPVQRS